MNRKNEISGITVCSSGNISYTLFRSRKRKKTISLQVLQEGKIVVRAPYRMNEKDIEKFFISKISWAKRKLAEQAERNLKNNGQPAAIERGNKFLYLGESYPLEFNNNGNKKTALSLSGGTFILNNDMASEARKAFINWYRDQAKKLIMERVYFYSRKFALFPASIGITSAKFRYGSCSSENRLSFTWRLIMSPPAAIDYVIIHELMHIKEKNHSRKFWAQVEAAMPDYREHRQWFKEHGHLMRF